jgi:hypothetical protein
VCSSLRTLTVELTGDSDYFADTFKSVVEYIHGISVKKGRRRRYAADALEIILTLVKKTSFLSVDATWIYDLLKEAAQGKIEHETLAGLFRLSAHRKGDDAAIVLEILREQDSEQTPPGQNPEKTQRGELSPQSPGGTVVRENTAPEYTLLRLVLQNVKTCDGWKDGWQDSAVYGGLITIRDIPGLESYLLEPEFFVTLSKAMEKGEKPFRVRKAAYDVVLVARDGWLRSADLRETLENLDLPRKLHDVVIEIGRSDYQSSFLKMIKILSEDRYWYPYLRNAMEIWLPLHHEGPAHALRILTNVGELRLPGRGDDNVEKPLEKVLEDEWAAVPGRLPMDLTLDLLEPLAKVTEEFKKLSFTESDRRAVLAVVEQVIPSLEKRRDDGYDGPGDNIRCVINNLLTTLRGPIQSISRRSTYW